MTKQETELMEQFNQHMKVNYFNFRNDYPTLVNRVILPLLIDKSNETTEYRNEVLRLEEENERLKQQIDGKSDRLS